MITKGFLYYTCNSHDLNIEMACRAQLLKAKGNLELGCVSREPTNFGDWNIVINMPKGVLTMHKQILAGLVNMRADVVFLCENDVLYHPSHFDLIPSTSTDFHYNTNVWRVRYSDGHAVWTDDLQQTSGCFAYRKLFIEYYSMRVDKIEREGFDRHHEPGPKTGPYRTMNHVSEYPNLDIRHNGNVTKSKWSPGEFRNPIYAKGWMEADAVYPWYVEGGFTNMMKEISHE